MFQDADPGRQQVFVSCSTVLVLQNQYNCNTIQYRESRSHVTIPLNPAITIADHILGHFSKLLYFPNKLFSGTLQNIFDVFFTATKLNEFDMWSFR